MIFGIKDPDSGVRIMDRSPVEFQSEANVIKNKAVYLGNRMEAGMVYGQLDTAVVKEFYGLIVEANELLVKILGTGARLLQKRFDSLKEIMRKALEETTPEAGQLMVGPKMINLKASATLAPSHAETLAAPSDERAITGIMPVIGRGVPMLQSAEARELERQSLEAVMSEAASNGIPSLDSMIGYLERRAPGALKPASILVFDAASIDSSVEALANKMAGKSDVVSVVIFGRGAASRDRARNLGVAFIDLDIADGRTLTERVVATVSDSSKVGNVAILRMGGASLEGEIVRDITAVKDSVVTSNVLIAKSELDSAATNMASLLVSTIRNEHVFIAAGQGSARFSDIQKLLSGIGLVRIVKFIGQALQELYRSLAATAVSV